MYKGLFKLILIVLMLQKFDMITVEYLAAVALDIFVYCYFGNQIILQVVNTLPYLVSCSKALVSFPFSGAVIINLDITWSM